MLTSSFQARHLNRLMHEYQEQKNADMVLGVVLSPKDSEPHVQIALLHNGELSEINRLYGGPAGDAITWAVNYALDMIRWKFIEN